MLRTDPTVVPTMMKGATVSVREIEQLRRIENVVRLGHVERIEPDQIVLEQGSIPTTPASPARALRGAEDSATTRHERSSTDDTITLQIVTRVSLTLSGASAGCPGEHGEGRPRRRTASARRRSCRTPRSTTCAW